MRQKGFATIFGLCLILVIAIIVKGIQEAENYNAREVVNFYLEQQLQNVAESGIYRAIEIARKDKDHSILPEAGTWNNGVRDDGKRKILIETKPVAHGESTIDILVEVWGNRGKIYPLDKNGNEKSGEERDGVYFMACASTDSIFFRGKNDRRAYAYVLDDDSYKVVHFMESP